VGRGFPDIALQALDFSFVLDGVNRTHRQHERGGPCASSPAFSLQLRSSTSTLLTASIQTAAGIISLLNDYLFLNGKAPLGFLNPSLYGRRPRRPQLHHYCAEPGLEYYGFPAITGRGSCAAVRLARLLSNYFPTSTGFGFHESQVSGRSTLTNWRKY